MTPNGKRDHTFDALKGLAILMVIFDHSGFELVSVADYFEVPAFFIISGILFRQAKGGLWPTLLHKIPPLLPPYIFYNLLMMATMTLLSDATVTPAWIAGGLYEGINSPLWYLKALAWGAAAVCLVYGAGSRSRTRRAVVMCAFLTLTIAMSFCLGALPKAITVIGLPQGLIGATLVWAGICIREGISRIPAKGHAVGRVAAGAVLLGACALVWQGNIWLFLGDIGNPWVFLPYTMAVFAGFCLLIGPVAKYPGLRNLGRLSLPLFCFHAVVIVAMRSAGDFSPWVIFGVTLPVSYAVCLLFDRIRIFKLLRLA